MTSLYPRVADAMPAIMQDFYDRLFDDIMIGFFFAGRDKAELIDKQLAFMSAAMGGPEAYRGRSLKAAHAPLRIFEGQFARRHQVLRETLDDHGLAPEDRDAWLALDASFRDRILASEPCHDHE